MTEQIDKLIIYLDWNKKDSQISKNQMIYSGYSILIVMKIFVQVNF